jgi:hypothetical protein
MLCIVWDFPTKLFVKGCLDGRCDMTKFEIVTILVALLKTAISLFIHFDQKKEPSKTDTKGKTRKRSSKKPR